MLIARKYANMRGLAGSGQLFYRQTANKSAVVEDPTHYLTIGNDATKRGFEALSFGAFNPLAIDDTACIQLVCTDADQIACTLVGNAQLPVWQSVQIHLPGQAGVQLVWNGSSYVNTVAGAYDLWGGWLGWDLGIVLEDGGA